MAASTNVSNLNIDMIMDHKQPEYTSIRNNNRTTWMTKRKKDQNVKFKKSAIDFKAIKSTN